MNFNENTISKKKIDPKDSFSPFFLPFKDHHQFTLAKKTFVSGLIRQMSSSSLLPRKTEVVRRQAKKCLLICSCCCWCCCGGCCCCCCVADIFVVTSFYELPLMRVLESGLKLKPEDSR